ncbi:hypothetical protein NPIL_200661 [Nephila pilipes]|uniref:Uncharacterized protein n=1 Tax=Nephila pilipes TaxID=299642 RepID=A0A8X6PLR6_NEPPI|nr:hypothetical protein NPIL_200661 [Nephila pilipes]
MKRDKFYTKFAIKPEGYSDDPYLLGNRMVEIIESSEEGIQLIPTVVTRSAGNPPPPLRSKKETIAWLQVDPFLGKTLFPVRRKKKKFEIPPFEEGEEIVLAEKNCSEFEVN